jgi:putative SOS response-associated peptidase YedK
MEANLALPAALIGDPVRAAILSALCDGRAQPAEPAFREAFRQRRCLVPLDSFLRMEENRGRQAALCDCAEGSATDAHGRVWETWRSPAGERIRSFTIITTKPNKLCAELHNRCVPALATARQYFRHLD